MLNFRRCLTILMILRCDVNKFEIEAYEVLKNRRTTAEAAAQKNIFIARQKANYFENEVALRSIQIDIAKAAKKEQQALIEKQKELEKERKQILKNIGICEEDLLPKYSCKKCNDTGVVNGKPCKCFKNIVLFKMLKESGVEPKDLASFDDFKTNIGENENQNKALEQYKKFLIELAKKFPNQKTKTITICGTPGAGKTFGAKCLMREVLKKGEPACFLTAFEMNSIFLKYHTAFVQDKNTIFEAVLSPELLIIDDLGTEPMLKNVTKEYLYVLVTERQASGKTTLVTTNLGPEHLLDRYGERVFSRLTDKSQTKLIKLDGKDLRHK